MSKVKIIDKLGDWFASIIAFIISLPLFTLAFMTIVLAITTFFPFVLISWLMQALGANGESVSRFGEAWEDVVMWPVRTAIKVGRSIFPSSNEATE